METVAGAAGPQGWVTGGVRGGHSERGDLPRGVLCHPGKVRGGSSPRAQGRAEARTWRTWHPQHPLPSFTCSMPLQGRHCARAVTLQPSPCEDKALGRCGGPRGGWGVRPGVWAGLHPWS